MKYYISKSGHYMVTVTPKGSGFNLIPFNADEDSLGLHVSQDFIYLEYRPATKNEVIKWSLKNGTK